MRSKIMRKAIKGLLVISLVFALVFIFSLVDDAGTVSTKGSDDESDNIVFIADDEVTEDMIEVGEKYAKEKTTSIAIRFMHNTETDLLEYLNSMSNKAGYIKSLIRADMERH